MLFTWLRRIIGEGIPKAALGLFCDQCATMLGAGLSVERTLESASQGGDPEIAALGRAIRPALAHGAPLSKALLPYASRLPPIFLPLVEVGDASGTLEGSFRRLAHAFQDNASFDRRYQFQVFNPWLILLVIVLNSVAGYYRQALGYSSGHAGLLFLLKSLVTLLVELALLFVAGRWAVRLLLRWQPLRYLVDTIKLAIPTLGRVARSLAAARWGRSFATLWEAGVPVSEALTISSHSALNAHYEQALQKAAVLTRQGRSLSQSLAGTQLLPAYLLSMVTIGEESGNLGQTISHLAGQLEGEAMAVAGRSFMGITVALQILVTVLVFLAAFGHA